MRINGRDLDRWQLTALLVGGFVLLLWVVETIDFVLGGELDQWGVRPRSDEGLVGVVFAPALHAGWGHLWANTVPVLVLGALVLVMGVARGLAATAIIWLVAGVGVWLMAGERTIHLGASGLVFGWITYLVLRGFITRRPVEVAVGIGVLLVYGGVLVGVLPGQPGVSWQGHLFGALGGVVAAVALGRRTDADRLRHAPR